MTNSSQGPATEDITRPGGEVPLDHLTQETKFTPVAMDPEQSRTRLRGLCQNGHCYPWDQRRVI